MKILYLTHDLSDPTTDKRVRMLQDGGAEITLAGFRRTAEPVRKVAGCNAVDFGQTHNAGFLQRVGSVLRQICTLRRHRPLFENADLIMARNLEMLAIAVRGQSLCERPPIIVYECLDIHRLLLRNDLIGAALRRLEGWLSKRASALTTSSPAFISDYFNTRSKVRLPIRLVENKVYAPAITPAPLQRSPSSPWRIGWFGAIRCRKSLRILSELVRQSDGKIEVIIRGRPAFDQFENFDKSTGEIPGLQFLGPYKNPEDLAEIYNDVHFTWAIDMFEEGLNSAWLLPNRIYEGGVYGAVPIALASVETGHFLKRLGIGVLLDEPKEKTLETFFTGLTPAAYQALQEAVRNIPIETWKYTEKDCKELVQFLGALPHG